MEEKCKKYELLATRRYDLKEIIELCRTMGYDYMGDYPGVTQKAHEEIINEIINAIIKNPELLRKLDSIKDEFWEQVQKKGVIIYTESAWIPEDEMIVNKKQYFDGTFKTTGGKEINVSKGQNIPALVYQKKKNIELNKIY